MDGAERISIPFLDSADFPIGKINGCGPLQRMIGVVKFIRNGPVGIVRKCFRTASADGNELMVGIVFKKSRSGRTITYFIDLRDQISGISILRAQSVRVDGI